MKMIIKLFIFFLFLSCSTELLAQATMSVDTVAEKPGDLTASARDTILIRKNFSTDDSMQQYKGDREFAYMKFLDSILRKTKDLTVDTISINNTATVKRKKNISENPEQRNSPPRFDLFSQPFVKIILWVLAIFLIGFIIYKLFLGENFFRKNRSYKNISDGQKEEEDISDPSIYNKRISDAVLKKDYRLAIRYLYLQTLHNLSGRGLLQFSADKTNYQYVNELHGKSYQNDFAAITLNYEYVWYGKFEITEDVYERLSKKYKSFNQKL